MFSSVNNVLGVSCLSISVFYAQENFLLSGSGIGKGEVVICCPSSYGAAEKVVVCFNIEICFYFFQESAISRVNADVRIAEFKRVKFLRSGKRSGIIWFQK